MHYNSEVHIVMQLNVLFILSLQWHQLVEIIKK